MRRRTKVLLGLAGATIVAVAAVHVAAMLDMKRERRARLYLGDRLYTESRGSGPPIVFLPGMQCSTRFWDGSFDSLAGTHRLIFVDELGFGRSPWPEDSPYDLEDQLAALRRTLVALDATHDVTLVAHSFGTVIAANYAATWPGEVRRVVLLGTPVWGSESEARERIKSMSTLGWTFLANRPLAVATCTAMCAFRPALRRVLPALDRSRPPDVVRDSVLHDLGSVDGAVGIMMHNPIATPVQAIGPRVVFVHGRQDVVTPLETVEKLARASGARLIVVDSDHHHYLTRALSEVSSAITAD
ncbi:MAG: alpha/beta hydrolase [Thermoanaerobaculia bacterium]|nr:alpha/beta hydrolase [Thermoanaerobaculia bacterium]